MKRIIDGVAYNTETATRIAVAQVHEPESGMRPEETKDYILYQTRGGAFFIRIHTETTRKNLRTEEWDAVIREEFEPMTREQAEKWILEGEVELLNDVFGEPPEAAAEATPSATIYLRVPLALKAQIEAAAKEDELSVNSWAMRCVERCTRSDEVGRELGEIISTSLCIASEPGPGAYSGGTVREMVEHMGERAEKIARILGWNGDELENLSTNAGHAYGHRHFEVYGEEFDGR